MVAGADLEVEFSPSGLADVIFKTENPPDEAVAAAEPPAVVVLLRLPAAMAPAALVVSLKIVTALEELREKV